jgi:Tol biopolymer transport system component
MTSSTPDIRPYLEIRTASPSGWSPDGRRLLVSSDLPGTAQVHRLDLDGADLPVPADALRQLTDFTEPIGAGFLPADPTGQGRERLLLATDRGGNERHQLFTASADPDGPYGGPDDLEPLVVDDDHIHRPGGVTRDGRSLAYATNRGDGVAFDTWVRDLVTGEERCVFATGGWTGPGGFSPDGRYLAVSEVTTQPGDNRVHLVDLEAVGDTSVGPGDPGVVELAPHDDPATVGTPSWLPDSSAFFFSTDVGGEFVSIARGTPGRRLGAGRRARVGRRLRGRLAGPQPARRLERGRADPRRAARPADPRGACRGAAAGPRRGRRVPVPS